MTKKELPDYDRLLGRWCKIVPTGVKYKGSKGNFILKHDKHYISKNIEKGK